MSEIEKCTFSLTFKVVSMKFKFNVTLLNKNITNKTYKEEESAKSLPNLIP